MKTLDLAGCRLSSVLLWLLLFAVSVVEGWSPFHWTGTTEDIDGEDVYVDTKSGTLLGKRRPWNQEAGMYFGLLYPTHTAVLTTVLS